MKLINKVGLEAEFFVKDKDSNLVFPGDHGFSTDEYIILGEFRADPGETIEECVGNYFKALTEVLERAARSEKKLSISFGYETVSPEFKSKILKKMRTKQIQDTKNIHGTDILGYSDDVTDENGKVIHSKLSTGLHVHFSREATCTWNDKDNKPHTDKKSIITKSMMEKIIVKMDKEFTPNKLLNVPLKYRHPGFYETKPYGFEYRSLPMYDHFLDLDNVRDLVRYSFNLLEDLNK